MTLPNTEFNSCSLLLLTGLLLVFFISSCDNLTSTSGGEEPVVPTMGTSPLPGINGLEYKTTTTPRVDHMQTGAAGTGPASSIDWDKIKAVLNQARQQTGSHYAAFYSVSDSSRGTYYYATAGLTFSTRAINKANGQTQLYFFESNQNTELPTELFAAYIPDSKEALQEINQWINSKQGSQKILRDSPNLMSQGTAKTGSNNQDTCYRLVKTIRIYTEKGGELVSTTYVYESFKCGSVNGEGGNNSDPGGVLPILVVILEVLQV